MGNTFDGHPSYNGFICATLGSSLSFWQTLFCKPDVLDFPFLAINWSFYQVLDYFLFFFLHALIYDFIHFFLPWKLTCYSHKLQGFHWTLTHSDKCRRFPKKTRMALGLGKLVMSRRMWIDKQTLKIQFGKGLWQTEDSMMMEGAFLTWAGAMKGGHYGDIWILFWKTRAVEEGRG